MKAIIVRKSTYHSRYWVSAEGVRGIHVSYEEDDGQTSLSAATKLANKYGWLQNGKYRLEEGRLPNGDDVFVFAKNPQPTIFDCIESAIVARIDGDWDNPDLLDYGALNSSEQTDIEKIISTAPLEETDKNKLRAKYQNGKN